MVLAMYYKLANPNLSVWLVTGDGAAMSIGGNHFINILRRNIDVKILMFNNKIYGLTKGQYSPTSELGKVTKSTIDNIGFDYPSDLTLEPEVLLPQVLNVEPLTGFESIGITSFGRGYNT